MGMYALFVDLDCLVMHDFGDLAAALKSTLLANPDRVLRRSNLS